MSDASLSGSANKLKKDTGGKDERSILLLRGVASAKDVKGVFVFAAQPVNHTSLLVAGRDLYGCLVATILHRLSMVMGLLVDWLMTQL